MLPVGVIGAGREWEATWRPALKSQSRLKVAALYDPIAVRGDLAAEDVETIHLNGVRDLLVNVGVRALLVLDAGWLGTWVALEAATQRIPAFIAHDAIDWEELGGMPDELLADSLIQPDLRRRYTPATMRLRELTVTQLGAIDYVSLDVQSPKDLDHWFVAQLIDWCRFIVQSAVVSATADWKEAADGPSRVIQLTFRKAIGDRPVTAEIRLTPSEASHETLADSMNFAAEVACSTGTASIRGNRQMMWRTAETSENEQLRDDRSSSHVQLDLFGRRLVGGLVPAATLDDARTAILLAQQAFSEQHESL